MRNVFSTTIGLMALIAVFGLTAGCQDATEPTAQTKDDSPKEVASEMHGEWWCGEHGVPEEECTMCSADAAKEFKAKGDWCKEHDRAESQCFICNPELKEKYAAKYRAKYGKEPPAIEDGK